MRTKSDLTVPAQGQFHRLPWHHIDTGGAAGALLAAEPERVRGRAGALLAHGFDAPLLARLSPFHRPGPHSAVGEDTALAVAAVRLLIREGRLSRRVRLPVVLLRANSPPRRPRVTTVAPPARFETAA